MFGERVLIVRDRLCETIVRLFLAREPCRSRDGVYKHLHLGEVIDCALVLSVRLFCLCVGGTNKASAADKISRAAQRKLG